MKKHLLFFFAGLMALATFSACQKDNENTPDNPPTPPTPPSLVGEWSGLRDGSLQPGATIENAIVMVHFSFREDGTFSMVMPAWDERRNGTYTLDGDKISLSVTQLEWVIDPRPNTTYSNVYEQYGVENIGGWRAEWPDDANIQTTFSINNDILSFGNPILGLQLFFYPNKNFDAEAACRAHVM